MGEAPTRVLRRAPIGALACLALLAAGSLTRALPVAAQGTETAIRGVVRDSAGRPVGGAVIDLTHHPTGRLFSTKADQAGRFLLLQLPVGGPYSLLVRSIGYRPVEQRDLFLSLGDRREVTIVLTAAALELAPLVVEAKRTTGRGNRIGGSTRIDAAQLAGLPVANRDFADLAGLSPLAGPQLSLGGQRYTSTGFRVDGMQSRNLLRAGPYNGGPFAISLEAVSEFEVNTHLYDVTQGRQGGGEVSAITKSGTNTWRTAAFTFYRSERLGAGYDFQGRSRAVRPFTTIQWGASAGGPILRNRAHFYGAFERQDGSSPLLVGLLDTPGAQNAAGISRDSLQRILSILGTQYGTATPDAQIGRLSRSPAATSIFARVDWTLSAAHLLTLRHSFSHWSNPLSGGVDQPIALLEARSDFSTDEQQALARLRSTIRSWAQNELRLGFGTSSRELVPRSPGVPRGFVQSRSLLPDGTTGNATIQFGGNRLAPDRSREWQLELTDNLFLQRGKLLVTAGFDHVLGRYSTLIAESQSGLFVFPSIAALEASQPSRFFRTVPLGGTSPETRLTTLDLSAFAQTEWRMSPRWSATFGLRWDGSAMLARPDRNPLVESELGRRTDRRAADWVTIAPRGQLVWEPGAGGRDVIRLGGGLFAAALPAYAFHNQLLYTGLTLVDVDLRGAVVPVPDFAGYRADPSTVPGTTGATPPAYVNLVGDRFRLPTTWKGSLSYQHRFVPWLSAVASVMGDRARGDYHYVDENLRATPAFALDNEGGRGVYVPAASIPAATGLTDVRNATTSPGLSRVLSLESIGEGRQYGATLELQLGNPSSSSQLVAGYAWSHARDNSTFGCCLARTATTFTAIGTDPRDLSAAWAPSDFDIRHRIVLSGTAAFPWGIGLSGRLVASSGRPYSLVVDGDLNGDESNSNDLAFLFDPDDPSTPADVAQSIRRILANPDNLAREYIRRNLGGLSARNALATPWSARLDVRATKSIAWHGRHRLTLTVDVYNLLNAIDADWGAERVFPAGISAQNPVVNRLPLLRIVGFDPVARRYRYVVNEQTGVLPRGGEPYQVQLGVRVEP